MKKITKLHKASNYLLLIIISWLLIFQSQICSAQNVGINSTGATPTASSILDLNTGNTFTSPNGKGLMPPNVSLTSITDIVTVNNPATSLLVYNIATAGTNPNNVIPGYYYWNGSQWVPMQGGGGSSSGTNWALLGNAGTTAGTNFMGTTDNTDVVFKRNNVQAGLLNNALSNTSWGVNALNPATTGNQNTALGWAALTANTTGRINTALGTSALTANTTGTGNTAIGVSALFTNTTGQLNTATGVFALNANSTGGFNTATGYYALAYNTTGTNNTGTGVNALVENTIGSNNTAIGASALTTNTTGNSNTATGVNALGGNSTGSQNTANGYNALGGNTIGISNTATGYSALITNTTGSFNTATGLQALNANTTGGQNTAHGYNALSGNTIGLSNTATGAFALDGNTTGNNNTAFGYSAGSNITSGSDNIAIGYNAQVPNATNSNQIRIGDALVTYAGVQVAWTITSDRRLKSAIKPINLGLDFITKLKPVSYIRNNDAGKKLEYGFIAQEVEETLVSFDATNTGMIAKDDNGMYSVRYNDLLSPIVKALQELNAKLEAENAKLRAENMVIQYGVNTLKAEVEKITQHLDMQAKK